MGGKWFAKTGRRMTTAERSADFRKRCPDRRRSSYLKMKYGLTLIEWNLMFEQQGSCCAICKSDKTSGINWHTDHCHVTNKVRGILCNDCNVGIGLFKDNPDICIAASEYLKRE